MGLFSVNVDTFGLRCQMQGIQGELHELNTNVKNGFNAIDKDLKAINEDFDILVGKIPKEAIIARELAEKRLEEANTISFVWLNGYDKWDKDAPKGSKERYEQLCNEAQKYRELSKKIIEDYRIKSLAEVEENLLTSHKPNAKIEVAQ